MPATAAMIVAVALAAAPGPPGDPPPAPAAQAAAPEQPAHLLLEVSINGFAIGAVADVMQEGGRLSLASSQFVGIGMKLEPGLVTKVAGQERVYLDQVPGLHWTLDERAQTLDLTAPFERLIALPLSVSPRRPRVAAEAGKGAVFSYDMFGQWGDNGPNAVFGRTLTTNLGLRLFSRRATAEATGYVIVDETGARFVRNDTYAVWDDNDRALRLRLGDSLTATLANEPTTRFGGVQWGRQFSVRPDIITSPMMNLTQGVAAPSALDLFINGVQRYSKPVDPGALVLNDLPIVSGANSVTVVVTQPGGRRVQVTLPFYSAYNMLGAGLSDFSVEAGAARRNYGVESFDYGPGFASGIYRRGLSDTFTIESSAALARGHANVGVNGIVSLFGLMEVNLGLGASGGRAGGWGYVAGLEHVGPRYNLSVTHTQTHGQYQDLPEFLDGIRRIQTDVVSAGVNFGQAGSVNIGYGAEQRVGSPITKVVSGTYNVSLFGRRVQVNASVFGSVQGEAEWGGSLTLNIPIGQRASVSLSSQNQGGYRTVTAGAHIENADGRKTLDAQVMEGQVQSASLDGRWRGQVADLAAGALSVSGSRGYWFEAAQSVVMMGGQVFAAGRIDDAFAVVKVGDNPGVEVFSENRSVGRTNDRGALFVNDLRSYEGNALSIDPSALPIDAQVASTARLVAPRLGAGLVAEFPVVRQRAAVIRLDLPDGSPLPVGALVSAGQTQAVMGYGGEVYLSGLSAGDSTVTATWPGGACSAQITAPAALGELPKLGPFPCAP